MLRQRLKFYSAGATDFIDSFWGVEWPFESAYPLSMGSTLIWRPCSNWG